MKTEKKNQVDEVTPNQMTVAERNDWLRSQIPYLPPPHRLVITAGVGALSGETLDRILNHVRCENRFDVDNDPYGEHDFGAIEVNGAQFFWKFDYYDEHFQFFQEDGIRVLTIMFADEY